MNLFRKKRGHLNGGRVVLTFDGVDDVDCGQELTTLFFTDGATLEVPNRLIKARKERPK